MTSVPNCLRKKLMRKKDRGWTLAGFRVHSNIPKRPPPKGRSRSMCSRFDHHQDSTVVFKRSLKGIFFYVELKNLWFSGRCEHVFFWWETRLRPFKGSLKILLNLEIGSSRGLPETRHPGDTETNPKMIRKTNTVFHTSV